MRYEPRDIWFPAKRFGWGWGLPIAWQGWLVFVAFIALVIGGAIWYERTLSPLFFVFLTAITAALIAICWWKGETPRWRWGGDD
jgi:hypothetical protein